MTIDRQALDALDDTLGTLTARLLAERTAEGHWVGHLASSALSTATAVGALAMADGERHAARIEAGLAWLGAHQNADGGWGDTPINASNISTTALGWAACAIARRAGSINAGASVARRGDPASSSGADTAARAEAWLRREAGSLTPDALSAAISRRYGKDRTFSVPILTVLAMAGVLGERAQAWRRVPQLPFELAACPHQWFQWLRLPVVSYALPALIAIGQVRHHHRPTRNPLTRAARALTRRGTLRTLLAIQPESGGFLEATPLTSFVVMSLVDSGEVGNEVVTRGIRFLLDSQRDDGSWPIDTNLATWATTLSVNALASGVEAGLLAGVASGHAAALSPGERARMTDWLLGQQHRVEHPYTHAAPGGWAWTDLSGGVPDADDTPGALLALAHLAADTSGDTHAVAGAGAHANASASADASSAGRRASAREAGNLADRAAEGVRWLIDLQNSDGGIPTFCRGWGALPFDRSSPDLTAHALLAWHTWRRQLAPPMQARVARAMARAMAFLARVQRADGAWVPLWFGNERAPGEENPTYGTARVLIALAQIGHSEGAAVSDLRARGIAWLISAQHDDGGWGGAAGVQTSIEETALAVDALAACYLAGQSAGGSAGDSAGASAGGSAREAAADDSSAAVRAALCAALARGAGWLVTNTRRGTQTPPCAIGLYFAKLWYYETLYPLIFALSALGRARFAFASDAHKDGLSELAGTAD